MKTYPIPASVAESIARRRAATGEGTCIYGCHTTALLYPAGWRCDDHAPGHNPTPDPMRTAAALRDQGMAQAEANSPERDRRAIDAAIRQVASDRSSFSANDVRPLLPDGVHAPLVGARFMAASRRGEIRKVGWTASTDPATHAHPIAVWEGAA